MRPLLCCFVAGFLACSPPPLPNGDSCGGDSECAGGFCSDGVCCAARCEGECTACITERTGVATGTCAPVTAGTDPDAECAESGCASGACGASGCGVKSASVECRAAVGVCDVAEACDGTSSLCPADTFAPATRSCREAMGPCDVAETCTGTAAACPADAFAASTVSCRASAGVCDVEESCSGSAAACPPDLLAAATEQCRAASGPCDAPESCTGASVDCPTDGVQPASTVCRPAAGACDVAEVCDGVSTGCSTDVLASAAQVCRAANGACDAIESCTGTSVDCPTDAFRAATQVCRPTQGACDLPESCSGVSAVCPADALVAAGNVCRPPNGACDATEACDGSSAACPADVRQAASVVCRASTGPCDPAESCDGVGNLCPADGFLPASSLACAPNRCTGFSGTCTASCSDNAGCAPDARSVCASATCKTTKYVFLTSSTYGSNLGGLAGADGLCAAHAADAGLSGTYLPWLSTASSSPRARFATTAPAYALVNKTLISNGYGDLLDGQILAPINRDEHGVTMTVNLGVITGTGPTGLVYNQAQPNSAHCAGWTTNVSTNTGNMGAANTFGQGWTAGSVHPCNVIVAGRLYCFEQ